MKEKEIINKKKNNEILSYEELSYFFNGYLNNEINDEEMTNMLKLICKYELTEQEIVKWDSNAKENETKIK